MTERLIYQVGISSLIIGLVIFILSTVFGVLERKNIISTLTIIISNVLLLTFAICGIFLWVKGWQRYRKKLSNPWIFALYLGISIIGSYVLYYKYPSNNATNS